MNATFQLNSRLALEASITNTKTATINPIFGRSIPYRTIEPVMSPTIFQLNLGMASMEALAPKDFTKISKPSAAIIMPSQNGK